MASTSSNSPHLLVMKAMGVSSNCGRQDVRTPDGAGRISRQPRTAAAPSCQFSRILGSRAAILRDEKRPGVPHRSIMQMHKTFIYWRSDCAWRLVRDFRSVNPPCRLELRRLPGATLTPTRCAGPGASRGREMFYDNKPVDFAS